MDYTALFSNVLRAAYCFNKVPVQGRMADVAQAGMTMRNARSTYANVNSALLNAGFILQQSYAKQVNTGLGTLHKLYVARYLDQNQQDLICVSILEDTYISLTTVTISKDIDLL